MSLRPHIALDDFQAPGIVGLAPPLGRWFRYTVPSSLLFATEAGVHEEVNHFPHDLSEQLKLLRIGQVFRKVRRFADDPSRKAYG
ncbi:MAG: hypothetical protein IPK92_00550 [Nitrospira sp.]|nr:hypothetical protein [Nitrospira sp.]